MVKVKSITTPQVINEDYSDEELKPILKEVKETQKYLTLEFDTDKNTVSITLDNGIALELREPRVKDLLSVEAWLQNPKVPDDRKSASFFFLKLAHQCATFTVAASSQLVPKPDFETFLDWLDTFEAIEKVGEGIAYFQSVITEYTDRLSKNSQ